MCSVQCVSSEYTLTMRAETLIIDLILLSLSHGQQMDSKMISFSPGVHLFVKGVHVKTVAPKLQILLPLELWMETCDASVLTCIITGLHINTPNITWKINNSIVSQKHTIFDVFQEPDGMFTALGLFYPKPGYKLKRDDVYRCEVEQKGIIYHEEVWPYNCEQTP